jgi:putative membrane protein
MVDVRKQVPVLTGALTIVSLALVFGAVGGAIPSALLPRAPESVLEAIPTINALISAAAIVSILTGIRAIRRGNIKRHRTLMVTTFSLFVTFLVLYLYRVTLIGPTEFAGPAVVETYVYLPLLAIHILLAIIAIPAVYYTLLLAASYPISELAQTNHPRAGKIAATLWLVSFSLGIVVYAMLYLIW